MHIVSRRVGLRFECVRRFGALRTRRLHGDECRFGSRSNGSLFHPLFSKIDSSSRRVTSPFFSKNYRIIEIANLYN